MHVVLRILVLLAAIPVLAAAGVGVRYHATEDKDRAQVEGVISARIAGWVGQPNGDYWGERAVGLTRRFDDPKRHFALLAAGGLMLAFVITRRKKKAELPTEDDFDAACEEAAEQHTRKEQKRLLKAARELVETEGAEEAGAYLCSEGMRDEACELFLEHDLLERAAEVRHDQNRFEDAAELFVKADRWEAAGAIYAQQEMFEKAARCYLKADKRSVAGEMFERAEQWADAGKCYDDIGFYRHAAQAFLKVDQTGRAAESLIKAFDDEGGGKAGTEDKQREVRGIAKKAGELLFKLERFEEAESILVRAGAFGSAAKIAFHVGAYERAAELFQRIGRGDLAAKALDKLGDDVAAARARGNHLRDQGDDEAAVENLERAGEFQDAGDLCRKLERYEDAGRLYSQVGDDAAAAEMFLAAGDPVAAAEAYDRSGDARSAAEAWGQAGDLGKRAEMLEKAGEAFDAGRIYSEQGEADEAIRVLQLVGNDHEQFSEACSMLGELFAGKGQHALAINKLDEAVGDGPVAKTNVDAFFALGKVCEQSSDFERAVEIYERILSFDYHYQGVAARIEHAKEQLAEQLAAQPPAPGVTASPDNSVAGRYVVDRELGRGGMGVVYLARDTVLERDVAYKVLPEQLRGNATALQNFLREAKAAAQLNHPNIVTVFDAGESEHGYYLAMELIEGTTLKEIVQRRGPVSPGGVIYILRQMAEALSYAHSRKVVHRDIKTANTMWTPDKQVKIMDFGLAKLMEEVRNQTTVVSGTPFYMSPEQTLGKNIDHRTDLYSLGVTLFELSTGELPFRRGNVPYHHVHTPPPDPRTVKPDLPQPLALMILRMLEKSPDARYPNAKAILEELDRLSGKAT
ncbi:MAG: protein kinase [Deltaproteobacteria bacterium]|nr:protein kinase [Deltaproteobacteria bacterium]